MSLFFHILEFWKLEWDNLYIVFGIYICLNNLSLMRNKTSKNIDSFKMLIFYEIIIELFSIDSNKTNSHKNTISLC